jgi:hypothetical protein
MTAVPYCTREDVKNALDIKTTAYANDRVDRAIAASTEDVIGQLRRTFHPVDSTQTFDYLTHQYDLVWRIWLDQRELCKAPTVVLSNGQDITTSVLARPDSGPPFDRLEIDLGTSAMWSAGNTYQRATSVTGTFGYRWDTSPAGTLTGDATDSATTIGVSDSSLVGVGSLLIIGTERLLVTGKGLVDTTATLTGNPDAQAKTTSIGVDDGTKVLQGEVITVGSERMLVNDIAGNTLVVDRAVDGSVLAAHSSSDAVYAPRTLTVVRGATGTTAAAHTAADPVLTFAYPSLVRQLTIAESVTNLIQEKAGYARAVEAQGGGNVSMVLGKSLADLRKRALTAHGRKILLRTPARFI